MNESKSPVNESKDARILSVPAKAMLTYLSAPAEARTVDEANAAFDVMQDPENVHICPLCHDAFKTLDFKRHAPSCITHYGAILERQRDDPLPGRPGQRFISLVGGNQ